MRFFWCSFLALVIAATSAIPAHIDDLKEVRASGIAGIINDTVMGVITKCDDPMNVPNVTVDLGSNSSMVGEVNATTLEITGVSKINITQIDLISAGLLLNMTISVPDLVINLKDYYMDLLVANLIPLYGEGNIYVEVIGLLLHVQGNVKIISLTSYGLENVEVDIVLGDANFVISGLINNVEFNELLSTILNDVVVQFIDDNHDVISSVISPIVEAVINSILN